MSKKIKCVVWDMDNTLWDGICLEDKDVRLKPKIKDVLQGLINRGIVNSISSKNEPEEALKVLKAKGLNNYFIFPQINWDPKEANISKIAESLNIGIDTIAFVDDSPFELESVRYLLPDVLTINSKNYEKILELPEFQVKYNTEENKFRMKMYVDEVKRKNFEKEFEGKRLELLKQLQMKGFPRIATEMDLQRISELVGRTNQFNSTGIRYTFEEIENFFKLPDHIFYIIEMEDKFGSYGRSGVALIKEEKNIWNIEILLLSCRIAGRGLGTAFLNFLMTEAKKKDITYLHAIYKKTPKNRQVGLLYKIVGFEKLQNSETGFSTFIFKLDNDIPPAPEWIELVQ